MITVWATNNTRSGKGLSRRDFLKVGGRCVGGLTLSDLLRLRAQGAGATRRSGKALIMVYLQGGPSHIDTYDLKPNAPVEYRGEFRPIRTNVPGFDVCELMPLQARIADKLALIRNMKFNPNFHDPVELLSGFPRPTSTTPGARPDLGSVASRLHASAQGLPAYVALDPMAGGERGNGPAFLGPAHKPFVPGPKLESFGLVRGVTADRLSQRTPLLRAFDGLRQEVENARRDLSGMDTFTAQALDMITSPKAREAFDVSREPDRVRTSYGEDTSLLQARRLVEAGVPVVSLTLHYSSKECEFGWDTHAGNFRCLRQMAPRLDRAVHALIGDLHQRGLDQEVAVVIWGEMGRNPRIGTSGMGTKPDGRDHWPQAGFTLVAGGGLRMGQVIGQTDARAERPVGNPYTPQNVLATLYHVLGIDPATTLPDHTGRPMYLLDDRDPVRELLT
jgi:hypothetical protein